MDERKALYSYERRLGGLLTQLLIEPRDRESYPLTVKSFSFWNVLSPVLGDAFEEEFLHWVAYNANNMTWISWVRSRWGMVA
jgi:hypothetical protein